jgi:SAM-dependent methyltransferase
MLAPGIGADLLHRYTKSDLSVLDREERRRFLGRGGGDPQTNPDLAWELLYRLEPVLYDRLVRGERLHPGILEWLPQRLNRVVEIGAGAGRLTMPLVSRAESIVAVEPAGPLRRMLAARLHQAGNGQRVRVLRGFFDAVPLAETCADLVIACSALTAHEAHGGEAGLREMERLCAPGGLVVIVWPNNIPWLEGRGYTYRSFEGYLELEFSSLEEALEIGAVFYPQAVAEIRRRGHGRVPYDVLGVNPPRDVAYKRKPA